MRISDWSSDVCSSDLLSLSKGRPLFRTGSKKKSSASTSSARTDVGGADEHQPRLRSRRRGRSGRAAARRDHHGRQRRSEEHTSELQSLMRISYAVFCLKKKTRRTHHTIHNLTRDLNRSIVYFRIQ